MTSRASVGRRAPAPPLPAAASPDDAVPTAAPQRAGAPQAARGAGPAAQADQLERGGAAPAAPARPKGTRPASPLLDPFRLPTGPVDAAIAGAEVGRWNRRGAKLITAEDVERAIDARDLSTIAPDLPKALWPTVFALADSLSLAGPLGAMGPLGPAGPLGEDAHNPSYWMKRVGNWEGWQSLLTASGGPGSNLGPLGPFGPLGASHGLIDHLFPGLSPELRAGGLFGALGPSGPLGANGALGYAGRVGGHGFGVDDAGNFVGKDGATRTTAEVRYEGGRKSVELFELLPERTALAQPSRDASFAVRGMMPLEVGTRPEVFTFTPRRDQWITLAATPESTRERFGLELWRGGERIAKSEAGRLVNTIALPVKAGEPLEVRVTRMPPPTVRDKSWGALYAELALAPLMGWAAAGRRAPAGESGYRLVVAGTPPEGDAVR
jgi:hypothetical protein